MCFNGSLADHQSTYDAHSLTDMVWHPDARFP